MMMAMIRRMTRMLSRTAIILMFLWLLNNWFKTSFWLGLCLITEKCRDWCSSVCWWLALVLWSIWWQIVGSGSSLYVFHSSHNVNTDSTDSVSSVLILITAVCLFWCKTKVVRRQFLSKFCASSHHPEPAGSAVAVILSKSWGTWVTLAGHSELPS